MDMYHLQKKSGNFFCERNSVAHHRRIAKACYKFAVYLVKGHVSGLTVSVETFYLVNMHPLSQIFNCYRKVFHAQIMSCNIT